MKQKDIVIIIAVAGIAAILSFVLANFLFGGKKSANLTSPKVDAINANFTLPSTQYFNKNALDPTVNITIGGSTNNTPFNKQ